MSSYNICFSLLMVFVCKRSFCIGMYVHMYFCTIYSLWLNKELFHIKHKNLIGAEKKCVSAKV